MGMGLGLSEPPGIYGLREGLPPPGGTIQDPALPRLPPGMYGLGVVGRGAPILVVLPPVCIGVAFVPPVGIGDNSSGPLAFRPGGADPRGLAPCLHRRDFRAPCGDR